MQKNKWICDVIAVILISLLGLIAGKFTIGFVISIPLNLISGSFYPQLTDETINVITDNFSFLMIIIIVYLYARKKRNSDLHSLYFSNDKMFKALIGLSAGMIICLVVCFTAIISGNLVLKYNHFYTFTVLMTFISAIVQASAEELLFRGFLVEKLVNNYSMKMAVITSGILFSVLHAFNPGVTVLAILNITIVGFAFSALAVAFNSLYFIIGVHIAWNFTEEIILGLPNSGITFPEPVFEIVQSSNSILYNRTFGIEATIQTMVVWGLIFAISFYRLIKKNKSKEEHSL
ncbi:MAG: type II CAAX endopeptidase family protein [Ruminococcus sp.]|nr:type II CAAX endopeptidase family protein [Ruminococcus sp.]